MPAGPTGAVGALGSIDDAHAPTQQTLTLIPRATLNVDFMPRSIVLTRDPDTTRPRNTHYAQNACVEKASASWDERLVTKRRHMARGFVSPYACPNSYA